MTTPLQDLDRSYAGLLDPLNRHAARAALLRQWRESLSAWPLPRTAWPTLPVCAAGRVDGVLHLLAGEGGPVFIDDDADGMAASLAAAGATVSDSLSSKGPFRIACVACAAPEQLVATLSRVGDELMPQGLVMITAHVIAVRAVLETIAAAGHRLVRHHRRSQVFLLPGPFACDDAGDLFVIAPSARGASAEHPDETETRAALLQPALTLDVEGLAVEPSVEGAMARLAERLPTLSPRRAASLHLALTDYGTAVMSFFDMTGHGCIAELRPDGRLLLDLLPYDPQLDYAARTAIVATLGTPASRIRVSDLPLPRVREVTSRVPRHG